MLSVCFMNLPVGCLVNKLAAPSRGAVRFGGLWNVDVSRSEFPSHPSDIFRFLPAAGVRRRLTHGNFCWRSVASSRCPLSFFLHIDIPFE